MMNRQKYTGGVIVGWHWLNENESKLVKRGDLNKRNT